MSLHKTLLFCRISYTDCHGRETSPLQREAEYSLPCYFKDFLCLTQTFWNEMYKFMNIYFHFSWRSSVNFRFLHWQYLWRGFLIPGGAEPTDTFQIWIFRRRDSLSWLARRGTVEERTPFHKVSRNGALERATMFATVISRFGDVAWSARSPELTVPDFFLWGFLKDRVFRRRIMTIQELK